MNGLMPTFRILYYRTLKKLGMLYVTSKNIQSI